jgi:hypothetical protein
LQKNSSSSTPNPSQAPSSFAELAAGLREAGTSCTGEPLIAPTPHPGQQVFLASEHPRRLLVAHRRFGKDWASIMDLRRRVERWRGEPHRRQLSPAISIGVIYPTYPLSHEFWEALKRMIPRPEVAQLHEATPPRMTLKSGAEIEVRTGSDADMLVARGYDLVILGEAARLPQEAWLTVMPALASPGRAGLAVLQTTPKGLNWIAREKDSGQWWTLTVPIWEPGTQQRHPLANPHISDQAIAQDRSQMPERWFQQEWLASFLSGEGSVFRNVEARVAPAPSPPKPPLVAGVDLAKYSDFSVFVIFDAAGHMVAIDRMNTVNYQTQAERLVTLLANWQVTKAVIESNGPGEAVYDMLLRDLHERRGEFRSPCQLVPFATTAQSKRQMIDALVVAFERNQITILPDEDLMHEFRAFEMTQTATGALRFAAPQGGWDDRVMACALAWTQITAQQQWSDYPWPTGEDALRMRVSPNFPGAGYGAQLGPVSDYYNDRNDPDRIY